MATKAVYRFAITTTICALFASARSVSAQDLVIDSAEEFVNFTKQVNNGKNVFEGQTVVLNADIDLSSYTVSPIGTTGYRFYGHFDGKGHIISGFSISSQTKYVGLFGHMTKTGSIRNLILDDTCSIKSSFAGSSTSCYVGGILGIFFNGEREDFYIENCVNMAGVSFSNGGGGYYSTVMMGGIVGSTSALNSNSHVVNCVNRGTISNEGTIEYAYIGGIIGYFDSNVSLRASSVSKCANYGTVKSSNAASTLGIGGIAGWCKDNFVIEKSANYGMVVSEKTTTNYVYSGGILGLGDSEKGSSSVIVRNCENHGEVSGSGDTSSSAFGGIIGQCESSDSSRPCKVANCVNNGKLIHNGTVGYSVYLGGITGYSWKHNDIENCMNFGDLFEEGNKDSKGSSSRSGGISGFSVASTAKNCANYGNIEFDGNTSSLEVGGIFGKSEGENEKSPIKNCLNHGIIRKRGTCTSLYCGEIVGYSDANVIDNCVGSGDFDYVNGDNSNISGIVGYAASTTVTKSYWKGGPSRASAIGSSDDTTTSSGCYSYSFTSGTTQDITVNGNSLVTLLNNADASLGYAKWVQNTGEHAVTFVVNRELFIIQSKHMVFLPSFVESTEDKFSGWYSDNLTSMSFLSTEITADAMLHGVFGALRKITFKYGSLVTTVVSTQVEGDTLLYPEVSESSRWCNDDESVCNPKTVPASDITLSVSILTVTYTATFKNGYDESGTTTAQYHYNDEIVFPQNPTRTGYTFDKWESDVTVSDNKMPASNVTFTAQWILIPVSSSSSSSQGPTNAVQITFGKVDISKEEMVKKIEAFIDADEGTYEIKEVTSGGSEDPAFIVIFKDVETAKQFMRNVQ